MTYKIRHSGVRWKIAYGSYEKTNAFSVNELQRNVQLFFPYTLEVQEASRTDTTKNDNLIIVGTCQDNQLIRTLVDQKLVDTPSKPQSYNIKSFVAAKGNKKIIALVGYDDAGVLYAVNEFNRLLATARILSDSLLYKTTTQDAFNGIQEFSIFDVPLIENRGIWTWGYVIYDYKRFFDNMARLGMNVITIWNDHIPVNIQQVLDYAHQRGVRVIIGFNCGWGKELDFSNHEHCIRIKKETLDIFENQLSKLEIDGVYFQTLTEHYESHLNGRSVASLVCDLINGVAEEILKRNQNLEIQLGLHATSVQNCYEDLQELNPKVVIAWEDAGLIPFYYNPITQVPITDKHPRPPKHISTVGQTIEYSKNLATFRNSHFAMVPKGWTCLNWDEDFEHHQSYILGERTPGYIRDHLHDIQSRWDKVNSLWFQNFRHAVEFYREIRNVTKKPITVTGLIEDSVLEEVIQPSVAIFASTIWNPQREPETIMEKAMDMWSMAARHI